MRDRLATILWPIFSCWGCGPSFSRSHVYERGHSLWNSSWRRRLSVVVQAKVVGMHVNLSNVHGHKPCRAIHSKPGGQMNALKSTDKVHLQSRLCSVYTCNGIYAPWYRYLYQVVVNVFVYLSHRTAFFFMPPGPWP